MSIKLLVYAANLHVGGGVQVASSVIDELSRMDDDTIELTVWASSLVDANLVQQRTDVQKFVTYEVVNHFGISTLWSKDTAKMREFDGILFIFGPHYFWKNPALTIMGFAQAWIIYGDTDAYERVPYKQRWLLRFKYWLQGQLFRRADVLLVELDHVRTALVKKGIAPAERVHVVHNCVSSLFFSPEKWSEVSFPDRRKQCRLGFLGRNYPHKNTAIFPEVIELLRSRHQIDVDIWVTFSENEWLACSAEFRKCVKNIGPLTAAQCPSFYQQLDGVIFPSLLECFSVTPLEAMAMMCPLFASDRPFVRDICGAYANYFDPTDPKSVANAIAEYFNSPQDEQRLRKARSHALEFSNPTSRAHQYLRYAKEAINQKNENRRSVE